MASITRLAAVLMMVTVLASVNVVHSKPTGDKDESVPTESPKVAELRHKLQRLHDILKDYDSKDEPTKQPDDVTLPAEAAVDASDKPNGTVVNTRILAPRENVAVHPKARALSAEDMGGETGKSVRRDVDEEDLMQLLKPKTKRQGGQDSIQALAKALSQLDDHLSFRDDKASKIEKPKTRKDDAVHKVKAAKKDVYDDSDDDDDDDDDDDNDNDDNDTLESSLLEELSKLFGEQQQQQEADSSKRVHHDKPVDMDKNNIPLWRDADAKADDIDDKHVDDDDDNGDDDDDDDDMKDLVKYLKDAGYTLDDLKKGGQLSKDRVIEELEGILIEDIGLANSVGVSIDDLIQDLEDKAFKEALARRLHRLLVSDEIPA